MCKYCMRIFGDMSCFTDNYLMSDFSIDTGSEGLDLVENDVKGWISLESDSMDHPYIEFGLLRSKAIGCHMDSIPCYIKYCPMCGQKLVIDEVS